MILEYSKLREGTRDPIRANPSDAGLDIFFCGETTIIRRSSNAILPTGLKFGVPHGYMLQVMNRSSMAAKRDLVVGAHCVDPGYQGELFIDLHNIGLCDRTIKPGDKIAQVVLIPVVHFRAQETQEESLYENASLAISDRGTGALGSTGQ